MNGNLKLVLGLLGGMGSGKSRVAELLVQRGARIVSGDQAGHEALRQPEIKQQLIRRWGPQIVDEKGEVSRRKVGAIVFADAGERQALEAVVFPWIKRRLEEEIQAAQADGAVGFIVLDAAIMIEAGWNHVCDRLVYVHAPREVRLQRLAEQRGWNEKEVAARETAQMSLDEKRNRADAVVDNSGSPEETARQVDRLLEEWGIAGSR